MDEERQETADWRIVWQMFFPCVISDLIGGCVEVLEAEAATQKTAI